MDDLFLLQHYCSVGEAIAKLFDPLIEVAIMDHRSDKPYVMAIYNNILTGRIPGDPISDLGKLRQEGFVPDKTDPYRNTGINGQILKSVSLGIRNQANKLIGVIGFHFNMDTFRQMGSVISTLMNFGSNPFVTGGETWAPKTGVPNEEILQFIDHCILKRDLDGKKIKAKDKQWIIKEVKKAGFFNRRGSIVSVAEKLQTTRQMVYRYLKNISES